MSHWRYPALRGVALRGVAVLGMAVLGMAGAMPALPASARVLEVGPGFAFPLPSAAAAVAADGDTIAIAPGSYFDCALWRANALTIEGTGPEVTITDKACAGKAAFVIEGDGVVLRNLGFARIRVPDGNGAGIRLEGHDLTVLDSRFDNNQVGILAGGSGGFLRIAGCGFTANGISQDGRPTHAVLAGALDLLRIEHSSFEKARGGDHVASAARRTELADDRFADEGGHMTGPLVMLRGGAVTLDGNTVTLAATAAERPGAMLATGDVGSLTVHANTLVEPDGQVPLLRNWSGVAANASANTVPPGQSAVSDSGSTYHRFRAHMAALREQAKDGLRLARHQVAELARGLRLIP